MALDLRYSPSGAGLLPPGREPAAAFGAAASQEGSDIAWIPAKCWWTRRAVTLNKMAVQLMECCGFFVAADVTDEAGWFFDGVMNVGSIDSTVTRSDGNGRVLLGNVLSGEDRGAEWAVVCDDYVSIRISFHIIAPTCLGETLVRPQGSDTAEARTALLTLISQGITNVPALLGLLEFTVVSCIVKVLRLLRAKPVARPQLAHVNPREPFGRTCLSTRVAHGDKEWPKGSAHVR